MCGVTGFWSSAHKADVAIAARMANAIRHRGPDDAGTWTDDDAGIALAHQRLSILDLSVAGHQPMVSPCGTLTLVFNGEIYNHLMLRAELERIGGGFAWRGHSDTETLLAALRHWGVRGALERINGMFAFALWDARTRTLSLARDRMGEKPLYFGCIRDTFLFGSELKALRQHPAWDGAIDRDALAAYLRFNNVPAPLSIYRGIRKLQPAHFVVVGDGGAHIHTPECYWSLAHVAERGTREPMHSYPTDITQGLDELLSDAVRIRMLADVPVGAFLSGGIDSSLVTAQMQAQSSRPVRTFAIGFSDHGFDEAPHARAVATHLGTDHTELYVSPSDALSVVPRLPQIWDEPFADSSQIPVHLVSELASRHVKVCLTGDGGDELFHGYGRYAQAARLWARLRPFPYGLRRLAAAGLRGWPGRGIARMLGPPPAKPPAGYASAWNEKAADVMGYPNCEALYHRLVSHWKLPADVVIDSREPASLFTQPDRWPHLPGVREKVMFLDAMTYLPDDILTKVDRATMAVSLEARVPLLDHRIVEYAWRVPTRWKYRDGTGKWPLRGVLDRYVPRALTNRPKQGFSVPIERWLCGPLEEWANGLLDPQRLRDEGYFDPSAISAMWSARAQPNWQWAHYLWIVLMFEAWLDAQRS